MSKSETKISDSFWGIADLILRLLCGWSSYWMMEARTAGIGHERWLRHQQRRSERSAQQSFDIEGLNFRFGSTWDPMIFWPYLIISASIWKRSEQWTIIVFVYNKEKDYAYPSSIPHLKQHASPWSKEKLTGQKKPRLAIQTRLINSLQTVPSKSHPYEFWHIFFD